MTGSSKPAPRKSPTNGRGDSASTSRPQNVAVAAKSPDRVLEAPYRLSSAPDE